MNRLHARAESGASEDIPHDAVGSFTEEFAGTFTGESDANAALAKKSEQSAALARVFTRISPFVPPGEVPTGAHTMASRRPVTGFAKLVDDTCARGGAAAR